MTFKYYIGIVTFVLLLLVVKIINLIINYSLVDRVSLKTKNKLQLFQSVVNRSMIIFFISPFRLPTKYDFDLEK